MWSRKTQKLVPWDNCELVKGPFLLELTSPLLTKLLHVLSSPRSQQDVPCHADLCLRETPPGLGVCCLTWRKAPLGKDGLPDSICPAHTENWATLLIGQLDWSVNWFHPSYIGACPY